MGNGSYYGLTRTRELGSQPPKHGGLRYSIRLVCSPAQTSVGQGLGESWVNGKKGRYCTSMMAWAPTVTFPTEPVNLFWETETQWHLKEAMTGQSKVDVGSGESEWCQEIVIRALSSSALLLCVASVTVSASPCLSHSWPGSLGELTLPGAALNQRFPGFLCMFPSSPALWVGSF